MRRPLAVLATLALVNCTVVSSRDTDAEIGNILASTRPIRSPIRLKYSPSSLQPIALEMRMLAGSKDVSLRATAAQQITGIDNALMLSTSIDKVFVQGRTLQCGDQPLLRIQLSLEPDGRIKKQEALSTANCSGSEFLKMNSSQDDMVSGIWLYPPEGVTTGTVLRHSPTNDPDKTDGNARGVVVGLAIWKGRAVVVIQLEGCGATRDKSNNLWQPYCFQGVNLVSPTTGLTAGAIGTADAASYGMIMQMRVSPL